MVCSRFSIKTSRSAAEAANGPLTGAVFGQVLVFALLFLPKRAAGLAALSGLAFTGCSPVLRRQIWVEREYLRLSNAVPSHRPSGMRRKRCLPFLELWGGDQAGEVSSVILHSALPPVGILLVDDLNDVSCLKFEAGLLAGDEVIRGGVIVKLGPHVHLWRVNMLFYKQHIPESSETSI